MIYLAFLAWIFIGSKVALRWLDWLEPRRPPDTTDEVWQVIASVGLVICAVVCVFFWPIFLFIHARWWRSHS